jgi:hypothetical protein
MTHSYQTTVPPLGDSNVASLLTTFPPHVTVPVSGVEAIGVVSVGRGGLGNTDQGGFRLE